MAQAHELNNSSEMWAHTTVDMIYGFVPEKRKIHTKNVYNENTKWKSVQITWHTHTHKIFRNKSVTVTMNVCR